jgi:hypothetical protein
MGSCVTLPINFGNNNFESALMAINFYGDLAHFTILKVLGSHAERKVTFFHRALITIGARESGEDFIE